MTFGDFVEGGGGGVVALDATSGAELWRATPGRVRNSAAVAGDEVVVFHQGLAFAFSTRGAAADAVEHAAADGTIVSPMPGRIIAAEVRVGDSIVEGSKLVTLEAMKMEHSLTAPFDGIVTELNAVEGAQVSEGDVLARIERREA